MATKRDDDAPVIWLNGQAKREYDLLSELKASTTIEGVKSFISVHQQRRVDKASKRDYTALTAFGLGAIFAVGASLVKFSDMTGFGFYLMALAICHLLEYSYVWFFHPDELSHNSTFVEYLIGYWLFPGFKGVRVLIGLGVIMAITGQTIRSIAMWTAGSNFHHLVRYRREKTHVLVRHGIYQYFRHPSYFGWLLWSVGTQVILVNPICFVAIGGFLWRFFDNRIRDEEETLIEFFGDEYRKFRAEVPTRIPFIN